MQKLVKEGWSTIETVLTGVVVELMPELMHWPALSTALAVLVYLTTS